MKNIAVIFIQDDEGKFFVHQRLSSKKTFPNKYGIGAGGHIEEGEEVFAAAKRELFEETGLTTLPQYVCTMDFDTPEMNQTVHLHFVQNNGPLHTDQSEWQWSGWMAREEVDLLLMEGKLCPDTGVLYQKYLSQQQG